MHNLAISDIDDLPANSNDRKLSKFDRYKKEPFQTWQEIGRKKMFNNKVASHALHALRWSFCWVTVCNILKIISIHSNLIFFLNFLKVFID